MRMPKSHAILKERSRMADAVLAGSLPYSLFSPAAYFFAVAFSLAAVLACLRCYLSFQYFKRIGVPGPKPSFFYGHYKEAFKVGFREYMDRMHKKYGPYLGIYWGLLPEVSITDVELIKLITIKEADSCFINRPAFKLHSGKKTAPPGLIRSRDDVWRMARQTLSPSFSSLRIKMMAPHVQRSVSTLVEILQTKADKEESVEMFKTFSLLTLETLLATAFGREMNVQRGESNELLEVAERIFITTGADTLAYLDVLFSNFPWLARVMQYLLKKSKFQVAFSQLEDLTLQIIEQRRNENLPGKYKDLLQLMLDATIDNICPSRKNRSLSNAEITSHAITFLLAGYDTTANTLTYASYLLALNPDVQQRLQEEIDQYFEENPEASTYQASQDIVYLEMVINETLRVYPPVIKLVRECSKEFKYNGITIPVGSMPSFPLFILHNDPQYWKDPEKFDPMRFTPEEKAQRPQHCYMPFGSGPRGCIGRRFALLETKLALIDILKRFSFVRAPDTQVPLETVIGITMTPKNGVHIRIVSRKQA